MLLSIVIKCEHYYPESRSVSRVYEKLDVQLTKPLSRFWWLTMQVLGLYLYGSFPLRSGPLTETRAFQTSETPWVLCILAFPDDLSTFGRGGAPPKTRHTSAVTRNSQKDGEREESTAGLNNLETFSWVDR